MDSLRCEQKIVNRALSNSTHKSTRMGPAIRGSYALFIWMEAGRYSLIGFKTGGYYALRWGARGRLRLQLLQQLLRLLVHSRPPELADTRYDLFGGSLHAVHI